MRVQLGVWAHSKVLLVSRLLSDSCYGFLVALYPWYYPAHVSMPCNSVNLVCIQSGTCFCNVCLVYDIFWAYIEVIVYSAELTWREFEWPCTCIQNFLIYYQHSFPLQVSPHLLPPRQLPLTPSFPSWLMPVPTYPLTNTHTQCCTYWAQLAWGSCR